MSIFNRTIVGVMALTGLLLSVNIAANAQSQYNSDYVKQSAEDRKNWQKNQTQMTNDIMRAINGPQKDPNLGVVSQSEMLDLVIGAFSIDKNDGGQSYRQFQNRLSNKVSEKRKEVEDFEAYKRDWIKQERARQQVELDRGVARERAARAAREEQRRQDAARAERIAREHSEASRAKYTAEKKRRAERYAAAQRRKNAANRVATATSSSGKYADDGLDDLPPPLIVVTPEEPKKDDTPQTCACQYGYFLNFGAECVSNGDGSESAWASSVPPGEWPMHKQCYATFTDPDGHCGWAMAHGKFPKDCSGI